MSKGQLLRALVKKRLTAVAEEIFGLFERTVAEWEEELCRREEENERQRLIIDAVLKPQLRLHRADDQKLSVSNEEVPSEQQQQWNDGLDPDEQPKHPNIKDEQAELWKIHAEEQLRALEESTSTAVGGKTEDSVEKLQSFQLDPNQAEDIKTESGGEEQNWHLDQQSNTDVSSEHETENSDDWEVTRGPASDSVSISVRRKTRKKRTISCSECGKIFTRKSMLKVHMRIHTGERPYSCSVCSKTFTQRGSLYYHMRTHSGDKSFNCTVCNKAFSRKETLQRHTLAHAGEKPFSCSLCKKRFSRNANLKLHMRTHNGGVAFNCPSCSKTFSWKSALRLHMRSHTGDKPYSCTACDTSFARLYQLKTHVRKCAGKSSEQEPN